MALKGIKVVEFAGLAPAPFCGMILSDFGANVIRIDKVKSTDFVPDSLSRGKRSIAIDLKSKSGISIVKKLCKYSDVLIEPFRPGIMEKFGLDPKTLLIENPGLIYARLTGYGQNGPYAKMAGHDLNYLAISGVLSKLGRKGQKPTPPVNLLADFAGGGLICAFGILAALFERTKSGRGQIIDSNMVVEGAAYVSSFLFTTQNDKQFFWSGQVRGNNLLDTGSPVYDTYETLDGKFVALACLEPKFLLNFLSAVKIDFDPSLLQKEKKEIFKARLCELFKTKTRREWWDIFRKIDACLTPVLEFDEAFHDEHNSRENGTFIENENRIMEPRSAPRLSSMTETNFNVKKPFVGQHTKEILSEIGYSEEEIRTLIDYGVVEFMINSKL
uniref:Alpha-methylacyl-CoA racemase n=1 Tax=Romanomermis culicivorax TaxID=13658 RepID=A0A915HF05_ROMCU